MSIRVVKAPILTVHDGDTFSVSYLDLGWGHKWTNPDPDHPWWDVRLGGCNARELHVNGQLDEGAVAARDNLANILGKETLLKTTTGKFDDFGRILAYPVVPDSDLDVVQFLIVEGWVKPWNGRSSPKPVPEWPRVRLTP